MKHIEEEILPNALMIGVDYDLFWTLNPRSLEPFIKAFSLKQKYDDMIAWRNGIYIKMAITSSFNKNIKYPTKPIGYTEDRNRVMSAEEIKLKVMNKAKLINAQFGKED